MNYKILTYGRLSNDFCDLVKSTYPSLSILRAESKTEVKQLLQKVDAIAGFNFLTNEDDLSKIKWIHAFGAGMDAYLNLPQLGQETVLTRTTGDLGKKMGEFCLAYMLADAKKILPVYENQKNRRWEQLETADLFNLNVLILGTGTIGEGVANQLKGHVKQLIGLNRSGSTSNSFDQICSWDSVQMLSADIDVVINTLPDTRETSSKLEDPFFKNFNDVLLINIGRGNVVKEEALIKALESHYVSRVVLDVFPEEPLPKESPLWTNKNVLISPHQSGVTSIEDVASSFKLVYEALMKEERNHLFVDREIGY